MLIKPEQKEAVELALLSSKWTFAKTMTEIPHFWSARNEWADQVMFETCVVYIRQFGYKIKFGYRDYTCYDIGPYRYWTMGSPVQQTTIINRAKHNYADYDYVAENYDKVFNDANSKAEDDALFAKISAEIGDITGKQVLDVGCGTGLAVSYLSKEITPQNYLGIDPSGKMLDMFKQKFPEYSERMILSKFEDVEIESNHYDLIISLYGSPSYVKTGQLYPKILKGLKKGGRAVIMFFKYGYYPKTHELFEIDIPFYRHTIGKGEADFTKELFNNYDIYYITKR